MGGVLEVKLRDGIRQGNGTLLGAAFLFPSSLSLMTDGVSSEDMMIVRDATGSGGYLVFLLLESKGDCLFTARVSCSLIRRVRSIGLPPGTFL